MPIDTHNEYVICKYLAYRYREKNGNGRTRAIRLPLVHIGLESDNAEYDTIALVDSGATTTHLPRVDAEILQPDYKKDKNGNLIRVSTTGAGAEFWCNVATIKKLDIMKNLTPFTTFRDISVIVPESREALPYAILGRDYIFERYDITFHENRQKMSFQKN